MSLLLLMFLLLLLRWLSGCYLNTCSAVVRAFYLVSNVYFTSFKILPFDCVNDMGISLSSYVILAIVLQM